MEEKRQSERGFTAIETLIGGSLMMGLMLGATVFLDGTMGSMESSTEVARAQNAGQVALDRLIRDMEMTRVGRIEIDHSSNPYFDVVTLQLPVGLGPEGPIWGAITHQEITTGPSLGSVHPGWKIRYRVHDGTLLREILDDVGQVRSLPFVVATGFVKNPASFAIQPSQLPGAGGDGGQASGGGWSALPKYFRVWREDPGQLPRMFSVAVVTVSDPEGDDPHTTTMGNVQVHKSTVRIKSIN